jgi:hypothetical protein
MPKGRVGSRSSVGFGWFGSRTMNVHDRLDAVLESIRAYLLVAPPP